MNSKLLIFLFLLAGFFFGIYSVEAVTCETGFTEVSGVCVPTTTGLPDPTSSTGNPVYEIISNFLKWITYVFSFLAISAFMLAGIMYLFSGGEQTRMDTAKKFVIGAIIGVVVALGSLMIIIAIGYWFGGTTTMF